LTDPCANHGYDGQYVGRMLRVAVSVFPASHVYFGEAASASLRFVLSSGIGQFVILASARSMSAADM
jgi:hypothetical protein